VQGGTGRSLADGAGQATGATAATGQVAAVAAPKANVGGGVTGKVGTVTNADRVIAGARARARACYQAGLNSNPDMEGRASFTLTLSPSGSVSSASVSVGGSLSGSVGSCIKAALSGLHFDSEGGGSVSGSFSFVNSNKGK
jgi:prophage DNA circulation protein